MPHTTKKQRLVSHQDDAVVADNDILASFDDLNVDVLANIFKFLPVNNIMHSRRINKKSREAVKMTIVPPTDFCVNSMENYNAMAVMTRAMPNLQQMKIGRLGYGHKYSDGEDPDEEEAARDYAILWRSHDIEIISNFSKLRILGKWRTNTGLNGRYPFLFQ